MINKRSVERRTITYIYVNLQLFSETPLEFTTNNNRDRWINKIYCKRLNIIFFSKQNISKLDIKNSSLRILAILSFLMYQKIKFDNNPL